MLFALLNGRLPFDGSNLSGEQPSESVMKADIIKGKFSIDSRVSTDGKVRHFFIDFYNYFHRQQQSFLSCLSHYYLVGLRTLLHFPRTLLPGFNKATAREKPGRPSDNSTNI